MVTLRCLLILSLLPSHCLELFNTMSGIYMASVQVIQEINVQLQLLSNSFHHFFFFFFCHWHICTKPWMECGLWSNLSFKNSCAVLADTKGDGNNGNKSTLEQCWQLSFSSPDREEHTAADLMVWLQNHQLASWVSWCQMHLWTSLLSNIIFNMLTKACRVWDVH